jgi:hypothetical protein
MTETTTSVARTTTPTSQRSRSQRDGSPDPSLVTPLVGVTSTMRSTPCCAEPLTGTPDQSSSLCGLPAHSRGIPRPLGGYFLSASSGGWSLGCGGLLRALFYRLSRGGNAGCRMACTFLVLLVVQWGGRRSQPEVLPPPSN